MRICTRQQKQCPDATHEITNTQPYKAGQPLPTDTREQGAHARSDFDANEDADGGPIKDEHTSAYAPLAPAEPAECKDVCVDM